MMMRSVFVFLLFYLPAIYAEAQFVQGTSALGASLSISYSDQNQMQNPNFYKTTSTDNLSQRLTINLPYGIFVRENVLYSVGINYSFTMQQGHSRTLDSNGTGYSNSRSQSNLIGISGKMCRYYPFRKKLGFYHSEGGNLNYSYATGSSENYNALYGSYSSSKNIPTNSCSLVASFDAGMYYRVSDRILLQLEINIINLTASYSWYKGTDNQGREVTSGTLNVSTSGTLSPNYSIGNLSLGMKYLFLPSIRK